VHAASGFYDVPGFLVGKDSLRVFEPEEVGDVRGKAPASPNVPHRPGHPVVG
jgi:hypothetical protein